jgi:type IV pilus assembly protein PilO
MQFGPRTLIFVLLLLAMPIAAYQLMFKPLNEQKVKAIQETEQKEKKLQDLAGAMARTKDLPAEIESLKKAISLLESRLPEEKEMDRVLQEIWEKAKANKLNVKSVRNAKAVQGSAYSEQPIRMVIEGPFYPGFFKFLSDVEALPRLTKINEMKITADEKSNGAITADLTMTIYFEANGEKVAVAK